MAKKRQSTTTTTTAAEDAQPLTSSSKNNKPPSKKHEEDKVEDKHHEKVTYEEEASSEGESSEKEQPAKSGTKRSADDDTTKQSKKKKKKTTAAADDKNEPEEDKKKGIQRIFTVDDEVAIVEHLFDFNVTQGKDSAKNPSDFYEYVKDSIHTPVSLTQLKEKIRRLKERFVKNKKKCRGKTPTFSNPVEKTMFELGEQVWVDEEPLDDSQGLDSMESPDLNVIFSDVSGVFGGSMDFLKSKMELIKESKRVELERKWKELRVAELKVAAMRGAFVEDQARVLLDLLEPSSSH